MASQRQIARRRYFNFRGKTRRCSPRWRKPGGPSDEDGAWAPETRLEQSCSKSSVFWRRRLRNFELRSGRKEKKMARLSLLREKPRRYVSCQNWTIWTFRIQLFRPCTFTLKFVSCVNLSCSAFQLSNLYSLIWGWRYIKEATRVRKEEDMSKFIFLLEVDYNIHQTWVLKFVQGTCLYIPISESPFELNKLAFTPSSKSNPLSIRKNMQKLRNSKK